MIDRLFVVVGAGASHGCASARAPRDVAHLPPLVTGLFDPTQAGTSAVLRKYPLAQKAAAELRDRDDSRAIEDEIRTRYRDSDHALDNRVFRGIPPYLQELIHDVSYHYTDFPENYNSLVMSLLRLDEVVFVSLNYDVLLDNVLTSVDALVPSMSWYVDPNRNWSLIKLHGSVNWARHTAVNEGTLFTDPPEDLQLDDEIVLRPSDELHQIRGFASPGGSFRHGELHYPVLSVPVGEEDQLACPDAHVEFLGEKLAASQPMHLLFLGYSGYDQEVLSLIKDSGRGIATLTIVDHSFDGATAVWDRLSSQGIAADEVTEVHGNFEQWAESGELAEYVRALSTKKF